MDELETKKIINVLEYFTCTSELKEISRQGWLDWGIDKNKAEKVASHVCGTQQLAFAIWSEFDVPVNIDRVILMLAFHETDETVIGDIPRIHELRKYKADMAKIAVKSMTENLTKNSYIRDLIKEYEENTSPEAKYAKFIDKLECDLQCKIYGEEVSVDVKNQENNVSAKAPLVIKLIDEGKSFSEMWMEYGRASYNYPQEFNIISEYAEHADLHKIKDEHINKAKEEIKAYLDSVIKQ